MIKIFNIPKPQRLYVVFPPLAMANRVTRPSNANAHPGFVDRNPQRRSKEDVQAERQAKAAAKARGEMEKAANIQKVAAIEKAEKQKARIMDHDANDLREPLPSQPRARRVRPRPDEEDDGNQRLTDSAHNDDNLPYCLM